jgi:hypothetical protein
MPARRAAATARVLEGAPSNRALFRWASDEDEARTGAPLVTAASFRGPVSSDGLRGELHERAVVRICSEASLFAFLHPRARATAGDSSRASAQKAKSRFTFTRPSARLYLPDESGLLDGGANVGCALRPVVSRDR